MGILHGAAALPARWLEPIGRSIKTLCVNRGDQGLRVPNTVEEMTERVVHLTPRFLGSESVDVVGPTDGYHIRMREGEALRCHPRRRHEDAVGDAGVEMHVAVERRAKVIPPASPRLPEAWISAPGLPCRWRITVSPRSSTARTSAERFVFA